VFASDAADRLAVGGKQVARSLSTRGRGAPVTECVSVISRFTGVDTVAARRRISDAVVAAGRHPL
jgi:hypothetical protein